MIVYLYNGKDNAFNGAYTCQPSPLEPGKFIVPVQSTLVEPPAFNAENDICTWNGTAWVLTTIPVEPTPIPPTPALPTIPDVTAVQIRLELNRVGLRAQVEAAVAAGSQDLKDKWQFGNVFSSTDSDIQAMATALGLNQTELDVLFTNAANL